MKHTILFLFIVLFAFPVVSAYDINDTLQILSYYKVEGVLSNATAKISIQYPSLEYAINNASMNNVSIGTFSYNYTCIAIGNHKVNVNFLNVTDPNQILGSDSNNFICGDVDKITWGYCPSGTNGYFGMWILMGLLIVIFIIGIISKVGILSITAGAVMFFMGLITFGCGDVIAYFNIIFGIVFMLAGVMS